jgi:transcription initiation factor TFIIIB Brf1 subunit/transcription initiation factor TFIIB
MSIDERKVEAGVLTVRNTACPNCGSKEFEMRNYSMMWHEGDIHCVKCGKFIRTFDAG